MGFCKKNASLLTLSYFVFLVSTVVAALPETPEPPVLSARAYLLMDYANGQILAHQNEDQRVEPASLTKMMTIYVVDEALKSGKIQLSDPVLISEYAWRAPGSRMFVEVNTEVSVDDLRKGVIIQSGNDASIALAEHVAGSEAAFVTWMNDSARRLGLTQTHFMNASGLPHPEHYTTAKDMALLAKAMIRDFPETYAIYREKEFTYQAIRQENRNRLLWRNALVDGIKTGHTDSAGYCLVASGQKDKMRLIAVVMGTASDRLRIEESNTLLNYGFRFFKTHQLYKADTPVQQARIWFGKNKSIDLGLKEDLYVTLPIGQTELPKAEFKIEKILKAPTTQGQPVGTLSVRLGDRLLLERPLVALNEVKEASFWGRWFDKAHLSLIALREKFA